MELDYGKAIKEVTELEAKYFRKTKWKEFYSNEAELIADIEKVVVPDKCHISNIVNLYSGYIFIHSFAANIQAGKTLTTKQLTQAKRLALQIKKAAAVSKYWS